MKRNSTFLIWAIVFLVLFVVNTLLVMFVDVQPVGLQGSNVGMAGINTAVYNFFGSNPLWHKATTLLGYLQVFLAAIYVPVLIYQFIRYRSFAKIDKSILIFLLFSLIVLAFYVGLGKIPINFRPVLDDGMLKPSYPSCHTILSFGVTGMIFVQVLAKFRPSKLKVLCLILLAGIMLLSSFGRLPAGDHWLTDIIGGLFLGLMLVMLYCYFAGPYLNRKPEKLTGTDPAVPQARHARIN